MGLGSWSGSGSATFDVVGKPSVRSQLFTLRQRVVLAVPKLRVADQDRVPPLNSANSAMSHSHTASAGCKSIGNTLN